MSIEAVIELFVAESELTGQEKPSVADSLERVAWIPAQRDYEGYEEDLDAKLSEVGELEFIFQFC